MNKIRCIAIDDEPPALLQMEEYIHKVDYLELLGTFTNAIDGIQFMKKESIDLVFLDIQMEHISGMDFLKLLKVKPKIVLTTAYDSYALQAFDLDVDDYLLKPISFERFFKAAEKIYNDLKSSSFDNSTVPEQNTEADYLFVKTKSRIQRIDFDNILYVEGLKEYLIIQMQSERVITLMSFSQLLEKLPDSKFYRVHKSYIVSIGKINSIKKNSIIIGEKVIPIGGSFKEGFLKRIG